MQGGIPAFPNVVSALDQTKTEKKMRVCGVRGGGGWGGGGGGGWGFLWRAGGGQSGARRS